MPPMPRTHCVTLVHLLSHLSFPLLALRGATDLHQPKVRVVRSAFMGKPCWINRKRIVITHCDRITNVPGYGTLAGCRSFPGRKYQPQISEEKPACPGFKRSYGQVHLRISVVSPRSYGRVDLRISVVSPASFVLRLNGIS